MPRLRNTIVNDNPLQLILIMIAFSLAVMVDAFTGVGKYIQNLRKLAISVQLEFFHSLKIKLESFQCDYQNLWQRFQTHSFDSLHLTITFLAEICIIAFKHLSLDKLIKSLLKIFFILYLQSNTHKRFNSF